MKNCKFVENINNLVKKSFGSFWQRDWRGDYRIIGGGTDGSLAVNDDLLVVARNIPSLDPAFGGGIAGLLGSDQVPHSDGSVMVVIKKYQKRAKKYANLYEQAFGRKVKIILVNDFYELFPNRMLLSNSPAAKQYDFISRAESVVHLGGLPLER